jgi:2,5-diamino-6-(ribosylamino)-4(3H)-pyrimidinone 5'-phosphate reductase
MTPKVIAHDSVSLDGSFMNFNPNMGIHYQIVGSFRADAHLIGSNTIKMGIELYGDGVPSEEESDFKKPDKDINLPLWVIPDTKGILKGLLHIYRRFEFCRDIVVLISEATPEDYVEYLEERDYDYHRVGQKRVDLKKALELLEERYNIKTVLADTGRILVNLLLNLSLVSEISLLIHPLVVGAKAEGLFSNVSSNLKLKLLNNETLEDGHVWLTYKVLYGDNGVK